MRAAMLMALAALAPAPAPCEGRPHGPRAAAEKPRTFEVMTSEEIHQTLTGLAGAYPALASLSDAQTEYGLPAAGGPSDCPFDRGDGCRNYILTIEDGANAGPATPEVFLSGALHGNERVGPTAVTEMAALLLEAAACEASGRARDEGCQSRLDGMGVGEASRRWLARLVSTRRIVIMPTANALGYFRNKREEDGIDPNRDFPFDILPRNSDKCMQTVTGRSINEVFREHLFQLSITFHAGMEAITYEWGAPSYKGSLSPDHNAQAEIANGYRRIAGHFKGTPEYETGTMNGAVYPVRGGMEDWAYAASWDSDRVVQCTPQTFGGYPPERTTYNESSLRMFNVLVEASDIKTPPRGTTGTTEELLKPNGEGNGHISRNLRIALLAIDLVEPYAAIVGMDGVALEADVVPGRERGGRAYLGTSAFAWVGGGDGDGTVRVSWTVGGGFAIEHTRLMYARWKDLPTSYDGTGHLTEDDVAALGDRLRSSDAIVDHGKTQWHEHGASPPPAFHVDGPVFDSYMDVSDFELGEEIAIFAVARLDGSWTGQPKNVGPELPPQAHVVNARTNPNWHHESAGKVIQGRLEWYSIPMTLVVGDNQKQDGTGKRGTEKDEMTSWVSRHQIVFFAVCGALFVFFCAIFIKRRRRRRKYQKALMSHTDDFFTDGLTMEEEEAFATGKGYQDDEVELSAYSDSLRSKSARQRGVGGDFEESAHTIT